MQVMNTLFIQIIKFSIFKNKSVLETGLSRQSRKWRKQVHDPEPWFSIIDVLNLFPVVK